MFIWDFLRNDVVHLLLKERRDGENERQSFKKEKWLIIDVTIVDNRGHIRLKNSIFLNSIWTSLGSEGVRLIKLHTSNVPHMLVSYWLDSVDTI